MASMYERWIYTRNKNSIEAWLLAFMRVDFLTYWLLLLICRMQSAGIDLIMVSSVGKRDYLPRLKYEAITPTKRDYVDE